VTHVPMTEAEQKNYQRLLWLRHDGYQMTASARDELLDLQAKRIADLNQQLAEQITNNAYCGGPISQKHAMILITLALAAGLAIGGLVGNSVATKADRAAVEQHRNVR
jgi:hypothetical protein